MNNKINNIKASELADLYQYGEIGGECDKQWVDECICWEYDWEMMEDEDKHCEDIFYISNLRNDLSKICNCPYHCNTFDDKKYKTLHLKYNNCTK